MEKDITTDGRFLMTFPKVTYTLHLSESFHVEMTGKVPNRFRRFWHWFFLGWRFTIK